MDSTEQIERFVFFYKGGLNRESKWDGWPPVLNAHGHSFTIPTANSSVPLLGGFHTRSSKETDCNWTTIYMVSSNGSSPADLVEARLLKPMSWVEHLDPGSAYGSSSSITIQCLSTLPFPGVPMTHNGLIHICGCKSSLFIFQIDLFNNNGRSMEVGWRLVIWFVY